MNPPDRPDAGAAAPASFIGLMSGTSMDGVDGVLVHSEPESGRVRVLAHAHQPFARDLRAELLDLNRPGGQDELARAALAANALAGVYAAVVERLDGEARARGLAVTAVGVHGQTVRHRPGAVDGIGYTLQLNNPALLAERCGLDVVADFRSRDLAAGGQAAPLAPAFHEAMFGRSGQAVAVLNLGGIGNLSLIGSGPTIGFDCGPGNALMDHWCERHLGQAYDDDGRWAASGHVLPALLQALMAEPYLSLPPPKSTGRDLFNPAWLEPLLDRHAAGADPADVQATLAAYTVESVVAALRRLLPGLKSLIVCGGGALNSHLMRGLALALPGCTVESSAAHGLPPLQVEAAAFAWLAWRFTERRPGNLPSVTGARGPRVLGALYPAG